MNNKEHNLQLEKGEEIQNIPVEGLDTGGQKIVKIAIIIIAVLALAAFMSSDLKDLWLWLTQ